MKCDRSASWCVSALCTAGWILAACGTNSSAGSGTLGSGVVADSVADWSSSASNCFDGQVSSPAGSGEIVEIDPLSESDPAAYALTTGPLFNRNTWIVISSALTVVPDLDVDAPEGWTAFDPASAEYASPDIIAAGPIWMAPDELTFVSETLDLGGTVIASFFPVPQGSAVHRPVRFVGDSAMAMCKLDQTNLELITGAYAADHQGQVVSANDVMRDLAVQDHEFRQWAADYYTRATSHDVRPTMSQWLETDPNARVVSLDTAPSEIVAKYQAATVAIRIPEQWLTSDLLFCTKVEDGWGPTCSMASAALPGSFVALQIALPASGEFEVVVVQGTFPYAASASVARVTSADVPAATTGRILVIALGSEFAFATSVDEVAKVAMSTPATVEQHVLDDLQQLHPPSDTVSD